MAGTTPCFADKAKAKPQGKRLTPEDMTSEGPVALTACLTVSGDVLENLPPLPCLDGRKRAF